jgi:predicted DNA-binding protein (UPF0251 family)
MPRPHCPRRVGFTPGVVFFKPAGVPLRDLEIVIVPLDEFEALRLADLEGLYQEAAAERMKISRPTFARLVEAGRKKVADALANGKAIRLEGGPVHSVPDSGMGGRGRGCGCGKGRGRRWRGGRGGPSRRHGWR